MNMYHSSIDIVNNVNLLILVRLLSMPTECVAENPLQRALADAIILMKPLDEIRILLACGAKVH